MAERVTACLITYKRPGNIAKIVEHLSKYDFIAEILIRDQEKMENLKTYGRYHLGSKAENEWLYVQDDDVINHDLDKLYKEFVASDKTGIVHGAVEDSYRDLKENMTFGDKQSCMTGFGAFIKRDWITKFQPYWDKYGHDEVLNRESDRILSILLGVHHTPVICDIENLEGYNDENAMCQQTDHLEMKKLAINRALKL